MGGTILGAGGNTLGAGGGTLKPVEFGGLHGAEVACSEAFVRVLLLSRTEAANSEVFPRVPFGSLCFGTVSGKNQGELFDGAVLGVAKQGKGGSWMRIFERLKEVSNGLCGGVCR
jgi:hypothetical protein